MHHIMAVSNTTRRVALRQVHAGFVRVGDAPGLGVELDYAAIDRLRGQVPDVQYDQPWIARSVIRGVHDTQMYHLIQP